MIARDIQSTLIKLANQYPIVTLIGPRQAGKTTLVRQAFPNKPYLNLEAPDIRELAQNDPRGFLNRLPDGAILDEIQRVPTLLSYLQVIVDENQQKGFYILTGSHQLELHQAVSQSLAGRTALLKLLPFSIQELQASNIQLSLDEYLFSGFFPRVYVDNQDPTTAYRNYLQTYIERDVRQLIHIKDLNIFQKFLKLCAGRIGQVLNMNSLSNEVGVSGHTIKEWLSVLEASFIIFQIQPYFENFGKRQIKSPKLYFTDIGLASYLLDIFDKKQLARDPLRGALFENLVILEMVKHQLNLGLEPNFYYYRDSQQQEVDMIYKRGHELIPIEIKSSETFNSGFIKGLNYFKNLVGERTSLAYLIYAGDYQQSVKNIQVLNYKNVGGIFDRDE